MATAAPTLPHWDMAVVFPGLDSAEFNAAFRALVNDIEELGHRFDALGIGLHEPGPIEDPLISAFEEVMGQYNAILESSETVGSYIVSFFETNSRDDLAQARLSEFEQEAVHLTQLGTRFLAWLGSLDVDELIARSGVAADHGYMLHLAREEAKHLMSPAEEAIAAELHVSGGSAWAKLHGNVWSQIMVRLERDGEASELPMSEIRNLAYDPDRETRRRGYEAELAAWEAHAVPMAAAINSIKGEAQTLLSHRRWDSALDLALFQNHIDRPSFDAMLTAARESFPDFRRYLRAKANLFGAAALPWYDLFAPIGSSERVWDYDESERFIVEQFGVYSARMSDFAARAFREQWIDAEPRSGKAGGGFCMPLRGDESRILVNYVSSYSGMSTLAHELGHAYHNLNLADRTMLQRETPSTLAETASIFCETIVRNAALEEASREERIAIIEGSLQDSTGVVVDITSRLLFEQRLFEARRAHELSVDDLCALTLEAQRETYGDGLDRDVLHPFMWAAKPHYYSSGYGFYNFPYMFGLLFGLGLYAQYEADPEQFRSGYDDLLSSTGMVDPAMLGSRFGIDIRSLDFWRSSLGIVKADIDQFAELVSV